MKFVINAFSFVCILVSATFAQNCGTDLIHKQKLSTDSAYARAFEEHKKAFPKIVKQQNAARVLGAYYGMQETVYTIPVVVHVLHNGGAEGSPFNPSTSVIQGAINYLNEVYNGTYPGTQGVGETGIQFALATRNPNNQPTNGINRVNVGNSAYINYGVRLNTANGLTDQQLKNITRWDPGLYYNIWVVNKIDGNAGSGTFVAGYALYPGLQPSADGTVMLASQMKSGAKTLPHEIGHALDLAHPFENPDDPTSSTCPVNTDCAVNGDGVCDTDPIVIPAGFTSRIGQTNGCNGGAPYNINTEHNFMNYTNQFTLFTAGQKTRMLAAMTLPSRASLGVSWALAPGYPYSFTSPVPATCTPVTSATGLSGSYTGIIGVGIDNRQFSSGITATDTGYLDKSASPLHLVPLDPNASYSFSADLLNNNDLQLAMFIDYDNDGAFNNSNERVLYGNGIYSDFSFNKVTATFVVPNTAVANRVLRMRVITELSTAYGSGYFINTACYNPVYGQAEDYPVIIAAILPVSWKHFNGKRAGEDVILNWATSAETNNKRFDVERSTDGASFTKIGSLPAHGAGKNYEFRDISAMAAVYFYRIVQVDENDREKRSNTIIVRKEALLVKQTLKATNPFHKYIDLSLDEAFPTNVTIRLFDVNGRQVLADNIPAGQKSWRINEKQKLKPGIYLLKLQSGETILTKKLIRE
ncbi:MAG: T9SS type A sorting domain-containing protein [Chitinophagaceae bacterium]|nr:MAG: T9SS type A sorting domain-containing protein [Chitinophagaceae bacterium]